MNKVSVVIPVYNGATFVTRTLESITAQTLGEVEIIVIDDGSTDNSYRVIEEFFAEVSSENLRVKILRQKNFGVSVARNHGFSHATGKYVMFFDSDDIMKPECLEKMYEKARSTSADIVICGTDKVSEAGELITKYSKEYFSDVISGIDALTMKFKTSIYICNGSIMYKTGFLKNNSIRYQPGCTHGEDTEFISKALFLARKVASVQETLIQYVQRKKSVTRSSSLVRFHSVGALKRLQAFLIKYKAPSDLLKTLEDRVIPNRYISVLALLLAHGYPKSKVLDLLKHPFIHNEINKYTPNSLEGFIKAVLFKRFPSLYFQYQKRKAARL